MQVKTRLVSVGILVATFACGGGGGSGSGNTGGGNFALTIDIAGQGTVTGTAQSINCTASCTTTLASGTAVHLDAAPAAGLTFSGWTGACSGTAGCDLTLTADSEVGATFAAAALVTVTVEIDGAGSGTVTSSPAGINCPTICLMQAAPGTVITLTGVANATSHFDGYGGATCHGLTCAFTVSAATKVFASFSSAVVTVTHTLTVTATGNGTVVSSPGGISCPGSCSAPFQEGATVVLTATASTGSTFTGWSGACTGSGGCSLALGADATVTAQFTPVVAADPCAGLVLALTTSKGFTVVPTVAGTPLCKAGTSDGLGNVYVEGLSASAVDNDGEAIFNSTTPIVSNVEVFTPLASGFASIVFETGSGTTPDATHDLTFAPDGSPKLDSVIVARNVFAGRGVSGGSVIASAACDASTPAGTDIAFQITLFDDTGAFVPSPGHFTEKDCPAAGGSVIIDAQGNTLLVYDTGTAGLFGIAPQHVAARWFDATGAPLTDWFDAGAEGATPGPGVYPLIGGGAALVIGTTWSAMITSGKAELHTAPTFLETGKHPVIVEGGKAYAMIPNTTGTVDIVAANGTSCGPLASAKFTATDVYSVGKDGTLIDMQGTGGCDVTYFPHALK